MLAYLTWDFFDQLRGWVDVPLLVKGILTPEDAALAVEHGVPEARIIIEDKATRTLENALYTARIMADRGWDRALVVSDPFHLPRALFLFRRLGIAASGAAVRERLGEPRWRWYGAYVREAGAFALSALLLLVRRDKRIAQSKGPG